MTNLVVIKPTTSDVPPGIDYSAKISNVPREFQRQPVFYRSQHTAGTIVIDTSERQLYLVQGETRALRYGIGVGETGFAGQGVVRISRKQEWPDWHPPAEMIARQPYLPRFMAGGPGNPLGARGMVLGRTHCLIHGTNGPQTIGHVVTAGCYRLVNDDVIDLYNRVAIGTRVIVRHR